MSVYGNTYAATQNATKRKSAKIPIGYPSNWQFLRKEAFRRENGHCRYCLEGGIELHTHHMIHRSEGGSDDLSNLSCICIKCHSILHPRNTKLENAFKQRIEDKFELFSKFGLLSDGNLYLKSTSSDFEGDEGFHLYEDNNDIRL
ncbi:HNH endonuclease [Methanolobus chelungpuianus]|uniref:HNH nuclease domain-containing protein n=1 Tax=Methanolobus chelungpuianus TaxID=502115 RepID=A0AAE3KWN4_9EURY|nr:HNH endonuclease [Methanolobus chelungpuianus]MCQ6962510.1 hypothetical protein [Methanolobus chelungpuianus]